MHIHDVSLKEERKYTHTHKQTKQIKKEGNKQTSGVRRRTKLLNNHLQKEKKREMKWKRNSVQTKTYREKKNGNHNKNNINKKCGANEIRTDNEPKTTICVIWLLYTSSLAA